MIIHCQLDPQQQPSIEICIKIRKTAFKVRSRGAFTLCAPRVRLPISMNNNHFITKSEAVFNLQQLPYQAPSQYKNRRFQVWESLYWYEDIFILGCPPDSFQIRVDRFPDYAKWNVS